MGWEKGHMGWFTLKSKGPYVGGIQALYDYSLCSWLKKYHSQSGVVFLLDFTPWWNGVNTTCSVQKVAANDFEKYHWCKAVQLFILLSFNTDLEMQHFNNTMGCWGWEYYSWENWVWCNKMCSLSIYLQRVSTHLKVAAENVTISPNCSPETCFWRKADWSLQTLQRTCKLLGFTWKSHPQFSSFFCRKSESTVMKYMPSCTTPVSRHPLNDFMLDTSPTGYQKSYILQVTLGDMLHSYGSQRKKNLHVLQCELLVLLEKSTLWPNPRYRWPPFCYSSF